MLLWSEFALLRASAPQFTSRLTAGSRSRRSQTRSNVETQDTPRSDTSSIRRHMEPQPSSSTPHASVIAVSMRASPAILPDVHLRCNTSISQGDGIPIRSIIRQVPHPGIHVLIPRIRGKSTSGLDVFASSDDASYNASVPQWLLLGHALPHGTHRTCKGPRCFRKTFPGRTDSSKTVKTLWKTPEEDRYSKSSSAFHPCTPAGARTSAAPQGGRPTGRAAEKPGGQSC